MFKFLFDMFVLDLIRSMFRKALITKFGFGPIIANSSPTCTAVLKFISAPTLTSHNTFINLLLFHL